MKKFILASASGLAMLGLAACSDSPDTTTTQSVPPAEQPATEGTPQVAPPVNPAPETGTGGDMQPAPAQPAPPPAP